MKNSSWRLQRKNMIQNRCSLIVFGNGLSTSMAAHLGASIFCMLLNPVALNPCEALLPRSPLLQNHGFMQVSFGY